MRDEEWVKTLKDGRKVKFIYQELPNKGSFISAQIERHEVVYSVLLTEAGNPLCLSGTPSLTGDPSPPSDNPKKL